jgi:hypothetical protein
VKKEKVEAGSGRLLGFCMKPCCYCRIVLFLVVFFGIVAFVVFVVVVVVVIITA